jgi:UDP-N-acetylmuramoyl-L-alanyl-D-glutamate--2,6-diaminopimelate ligase
MAGAVAASADVLWHTSDNPRTEDPECILADAAPGIPESIRADGTRYHRNADRRETVRQALADCRPGDLLLLAGKGHEPYQEIHGVKHPYSDRSAVEAVLRSKAEGNV